jgi:hypothetical protein
MKIVADTNVWYYLGDDEALFEKVKNEPICPNHINLIELCSSENLVNKEELVRRAVQKIFYFQENTIFEHPFVSIGQLNCKYDYDIEKEIGDILRFTSNFAKGATVDNSKKDDFFNWVAEKKAIKVEMSEMFNKAAEEIRVKITNKKKHRNNDTYQLRGEFINMFVSAVTQNKCNIIGMELNNIELLMETLDTYFKNIELSSMKIEPNDWNDLALLGYVRPGDMYWTFENRWKNLIIQAGMEKYLYQSKLHKK